MSNEIKLGNVMIDCDNELKLQRFYGKLLGWEMCNLFDRDLPFAVRKQAPTDSNEYFGV